MNWLAHLLLSEPAPEFRLGSLLPDMMPLSALSELSPEFQRGIARHLRVDVFTDSHPVFRRSVARFQTPWRRFAGILTDVFYDHVLARCWGEFASQPLPEFAAEIYNSLESCWDVTPPNLRERLRHMCDEDWLCTYAELDGIAYALGRLGGRLRQPVDLAPSVSILQSEYSAFQEDFREFFPQLMQDLNLRDTVAIVPPISDFTVR